MSASRRAALWRFLRDSDPDCGVPLERCPRKLLHPHRPGQGFIPTQRQLEILEDDHLEKLVSGGYRGAKSRTGSMAMFLLTMQFFADYGERAAGQVAWLVGADYERTRAEFDHPEGSLAEDFMRFPFFKEKTKRIDPGQIELMVPIEDEKGQRAAPRPFVIKTKSATDETSLGMESPIWILVCEAAHVSHDVYLRLRSRVSEARARFPGYGVLFMEGTMENSLGWYPSLYTLWQSESLRETANVISFNLPSESNTFLYPGGAADPGILELKASLPADVFLERHMGVPSPPRGRVHPDFSTALHVRKVVYDASEPVYLGIDPGYSGQPSHYAVEAAQRINGQWRVFWEFWKAGYTAEQVCEVVTAQPFWKNPLKVGVIDTAGATHAGAMESNAEIWMKKTGLVLQHQKVNVLPGIDKFNSVLKANPLTGEPRLIIDPSCQGVISELGGCLPPDASEREAGEMVMTRQMRVYSWQKDHEGGVIGKVPRDQYNDGIKALTYLFVGQEGYARHERAAGASHIRRWRERIRV